MKIKIRLKETVVTFGRSSSQPMLYPLRWDRQSTGMLNTPTQSTDLPLLQSSTGEEESITHSRARLKMQPQGGC